MTIKLTYDEFEEQLQETDEESLQWDPSDNLDTTYKFDTRISQGYRREIKLRGGRIYLGIDHHQMIEPLVVETPGSAGSHLAIDFLLSGQGQSTRSTTTSSEISTYGAGEYFLHGQGLRLARTDNDSDLEPFHLLMIEFCPSVIRSFLSSSEQALPKHFQHLVKAPGAERHTRCSDMQPVMKAVLQQILHCSYQGMVKRAYLESKVIELAALVLDRETIIQQGEIKKKTLKPEQIERVHYAKEILLGNLSNPPSLEDLARQSGLNELLLRKGFRQAFDTTVFELLRSHRFDLAKQLLAEQDLNIGEVARRVGYASVSHFSKAFEQKFGIRPKAYQKKCR